MKQVYLVSEDEVTRAIVRRILTEYAPALTVKSELPERGSGIRSKIINFNRLSETTPVILLIDLDTTDCAPVLKSKLLEGIEHKENFVINIAVDEAEAWLMADRENFSEYLSVDLDVIPQSTLKKQGGMKECREMDVPTKTSYYLTHSLVFMSDNDEIKARIGAVGRRCKGKEYNTALVPFIENMWDIEKARRNSDSLCRMVRRIQQLERRIVVSGREQE